VSDYRKEYERAKELKQQLEKKYDEFEVSDNWNKRKSKKEGENVYQSWKHLDDDTTILMSINKNNPGYYFGIEYQSNDLKEIEQSLSDGSYYVTTPYGL